MKKLVPILFLLLFSFCSNKRESNLPRIIVPEVDNVVEVNSKHMLQSQPELLGLNFTKDTSVIMHKDRNFNKSIAEFRHDTILPKYNFKIIIDTTYDFHYKNYEYKWLDLIKKVDSLLNLKYSMREIEPDLIMKVYYDKLTKLRRNYVQAFPLLVYNYENKNSYIYTGVGCHQMIQEAKDLDGKWKPIEYLNNQSIDVIIPYFYKLKPKNYLATAIIKYHGDFKTKIRVKIRLNNYYYYSNEITGYINQSQFNDNFLNFRFYKTLEPDLDDEWYKEKKEYSLLKRKL